MVSDMGSLLTTRTAFVTNTVRCEQRSGQVRFPDMDAPARPRSTRDRPAKAPLSENAIVDAALAITKAEGLDAVTMRRVAAELDTGAASLYVYVRNRDELLRAMLDRARRALCRWSRPSRNAGASRSTTCCAASARRWRPIRDWPALLPGELLTTDNALAGAENLLGILLAGGIATQDAAWACDILTLIVTATAVEADVRRAAGHATDADRDEAVGRMRETFAGLPTERFPILVGHAAELVAGNGDERFRFAIDTFLDGLVARAALA